MRSALYIPQGTWHGVEAQSAELEIFWVVSPPHFAETLRESAKVSDAGKVPADLDEVGRKHGYRDSRVLRPRRRACYNRHAACPRDGLSFLDCHRPQRTVDCRGDLYSDPRRNRRPRLGESPGEPLKLTYFPVKT